MESYYQRNKEKCKALVRAWRKAHPEKVKEFKRRDTINNLEKNLARVREWKRNNPERVRAANLKYLQNNREKINQAGKAWQKKLREEFLDAYGHKCECCGETATEFLTLEHKNGGGAKHRREEGRRLYMHLKRLGWPKDNYGLLCWNCNSSRGAYGYCPHERNLHVNLLQGLAC